MLQPSQIGSAKWNEQLNERHLRFIDGSPVKLTIPEAVVELMQDDFLVVGGYIRDEIARLFYNGGQIALSTKQHQLLSEQKFVPQKYLPPDKPFIDIDMITTTSAVKLQERGFRPTRLPGYYVTRRCDKNLGKIINIGVSIREGIDLAADVKGRDFYSNTLFMDKQGLVYDISSLALLGVITKILMITNPNPCAAFGQDCVQLLRALYFQARDSYTFEPLLEEAIHKFANDTKELQKAWAKIPIGRRFSLWEKYFGGGAGSKFFAILEANNLINFFFPPIVNDEKQESNSWIKARLAEIDRSDYYNFEHPGEYFYAVLIAAVRKYHRGTFTVQSCLNSWGIPEHVNISSALIDEFATMTELTVRAKPNRQTDLIRMAELKAIRPKSAPVSPALSPPPTHSPQISSARNSPLFMTRAITQIAASTSSALSPSVLISPSPMITSTSPAHTYSPLNLPKNAVCSIPSRSQQVVWLSTTEQKDQTSGDRGLSPKVSINCGSSAAQDATSQSNQVTEPTPSSKVVSKKQMKRQNVEARKQIYIQWQVEQEQEKQAKLAARETRKVRPVNSLSTQFVPITTASSAVVVAEAVPVMKAVSTAAASLASSSSETAAIAVTLASMSATLATLASAKASVEVASAKASCAITSAAISSSFESKDIKSTLPEKIRMCDYIGGPVYSMNREDFSALAIALTPTEEIKLSDTSHEYGCCYCGCIEGWRVCRCDEMAKIKLDIPGHSESITIYLSPKKNMSNLIQRLNLSRLQVWASLMKGQPICQNDYNQGKKIIIAHDEMLKVFKQSQASSSTIMIPEEQYAVVSFLEWTKYVRINYGNELLAACHFFNQRHRNDDFASTSIISLLNNVLCLYAFWRYENGSYSCHFNANDNARRLLLEFLELNKAVTKSAVEPFGDNGFSIRLFGVNVKKLTQAGKNITLEYQVTTKRRCCSISNCVML